VPTGAPGPAEHAELADSLSMAFLVLLEELSPVERAVLYDAEGRVVSVIELDTGPNGYGSDVVQTMHAVVNPDKLAHLGPVSDVARLPGSRPSPGGPAADGGA
jgi:hypothetical protein